MSSIPFHLRERSPSPAEAHANIGFILAVQGKNEEAAAVQKRFAKAWAGADVKIAASSY